MGRKRLEKKALQKLESLERQLEALARRGADEDFLATLHGHGRAPLSPAVAGLYAEVMDRALRQALAGGDLPRIDRLVREMRPEAASRPWARLAAAVAHLGEGRLEEARAGLTGLRSASPPPEIEAAATALLSLCTPGPGAEAPVQRALDGFYRSLSTLAEQACRPEAIDRGKLEEDLGILRAALSVEPAARKLLDAAQSCLLRLRDLADLEKTLREEEGSTGLSRLFLERVRRLAVPLLEAFRDAPATGLIQPLRHAVRLRWRAVLSLVIERGDEDVWAASLAEFPALFALDLETGRGEGPSWLAHRQVARELLAARRHQELARRLASWGRSEKVPERLARLWSLELWAWERAAAGSDAEDEIVSAFSDPGMHDVLLRLAAMAGEIEQRFPAEQRPAVARFLRVQLFDFFEALFFSDPFYLDAAAALLRHLPDDPGLLAVAVTAAVCSEDRRACVLFASRIAARKSAPNVEIETEIETEIEPLLRLIPELAHESARDTARILPLLRPLLGEKSWSGAVAALVQQLANLTCSSLRQDDSESWVQDILQDLAVYRKALPESGVLSALEAAVRCLLRSGKPEVLRQALERNPGLEPALVALRVLMAGGSAPIALQETRETVIERLDVNWRLWRPVLPALVIGAEKGTVRKLRNRLKGILRQEAPGDTDRKALESALKEISRLQRWAREMSFFGLPSASRKRTAAPETPRPKKPRRRRASEDIQPELF